MTGTTMAEVSGHYLLRNGLRSPYAQPLLSVNTSMDMAHSLCGDGGAHPPYNSYHSQEASSFANSQYRVSKPFSRSEAPSRKEWERHRPEITRLYIDERWKLKDPVKHMLSNHGFRANERMYKKRISDWDLRRNLNRDERDAVCNLINVHGEKNMTVIVRGQPRKLTLFQRNLRQASQAAKSQHTLPAQLCRKVR